MTSPTLVDDAVPSEKLDIEKILHTLVVDFSKAPLAHGKRMRDLLRMDSAAFRLASVANLRSIVDPRGCRYLVTLLWTYDLLIPLLSDTSLPKELSLAMAQTAAAVDPQVPIRLVRYLVAEMLEGHELEETAAGRLLEILSFISDSTTIQPFLRQMILHPSARIRSKITLLVGRGQAAVRAVNRLLHDEDARVRGNAVEALWTGNHPDIPGILRTALQDVNNRVIGNAILGLYLRGDASYLRPLIDLFGHQEPVFRSTAVWVMGRTQDPRFLCYLGRLLGESKGQFRPTVFKAVNAIKTASLARAEKPPLDINILEVSGFDTREYQVRLTVTGQNEDLPEVKPAEFTITAGLEPIIDYTCEERRSDHNSVAFVMPWRASTSDAYTKHVKSAIKACLSAKKLPEKWAIVRYRELPETNDQPKGFKFMGHDLSGSATPAAAPPGASDTAPSTLFAANAAVLQTAIDAQVSRFDAASALLPSIEEVLATPRPSRGARHLIVFLDEAPPLDEPGAKALKEAALQHGFSISAISTRPSPDFEWICRATSGAYRRLHDVELLVAEVKLVYNALRRHFVISFTLPEGSPPLTRVAAVVSTPNFAGEGAWEPPTVPPAPPPAEQP